MADLYASITECLGAYPDLAVLDSCVLEYRSQVLQSMIMRRTNNQFPAGFPLDVVDGAIRLILYDERMQGKEGVKSESLSRYSVSYATDSIADGYPSGMLDFLKPYMKARF